MLAIREPICGPTATRKQFCREDDVAALNPACEAMNRFPNINEHKHQTLFEELGNKLETRAAVQKVWKQTGFVSNAQKTNTL